MNHKYISALILFAALFFVACEEMPEILDEDIVSDPRLVAGPYIIESGKDAPEIAYMRTNIHTVAGIRVNGSKDKLVRRYGRSSKEHKLDLTSLLDLSQPQQEFTVLLDDVRGAVITLQHPQPGVTTTLGFLGGGKNRADLLKQAADKLVMYRPAATVFTGGSFPLDERIATWDKDFFNPLKNLTPGSPLLMLPEDQALLPIGAGRGDTRLYWSENIGSVHLVFLAIGSLKQPAKRQEALAWMREDLASSGERWTVLVLSEPLFAAQKIYARAIETMGTILETGGVDLVVSGGGNYYQRTLPIQAAGSKPVRYIVSGGINTGKTLPVGREYRAAMANRPHIAVLSAGEDFLKWQAVALDNSEVLDEVTIDKDGRSLSGEPAVEKMDILTDALSSLTLQREVVNIATQAAKAVKNPDKKQDISFILANASAQNIKGELIWDIPYDSAYLVEPVAMKFGLESGFEGKVAFTVKQLSKNADASLPVLRVNMHGVGAASQPLLLTKRKYARMQRWSSQESVLVDGMMKEENWKEIPLLEGFTVLATGKEPKQPFEARVSYDNRGIYVLTRAAAQNPDQIVTQAKNHDDPVHKDESIEVFIDPKNNGRDYYQFAVNTQGVILDRSNSAGLAWNPRWEAVVQNYDTYYTVEMFIPYQALGVYSVPNNGAKWGLNICRNDYQNSAVRKNPFAAADVAEIAKGEVSVSRMNIGALAEQELGESAAADEDEAAAVTGNGFEVVQWADTYGDNSRSGLYGEITFSE